MTDESQAQEMTQILEEQIRYFNRNWILNYYAGYVCILAASILSLAAGILAATDQSTPMIRAIVAGLPAFFLTMYATFRFQSRSNWHSRQAMRRRELLHALKFENKTVKELSKQLRQYNDAGWTEWVRISDLAPQGHSTENDIG